MNDIALVFAACALKGINDHPMNVRADLYDFAAELLMKAGHEQEANVASSAAHHIREAETSQLLFRNILNAEPLAA